MVAICCQGGSRNYIRLRAAKSRLWSGQSAWQLVICSFYPLANANEDVIISRNISPEELKKNHSPVVFLYDVCVSGGRLGVPECWESPLRENWELLELRRQSLILEKVWEWGRLPRCIDPVRNSRGCGGGSWS